MSEAITRGIRVHVETEYAASQSNAQLNEYCFLYTVTLTNETSAAVQLLSRHWIITDAMGEVMEVRGPGVIGKQPVLAPGESFQYTSGCKLTTPFGSMRGTYHMIADGGEGFDIEIPQFTLTEPHTTVH